MKTLIYLTALVTLCGCKRELSNRDALDQNDIMFEAGVTCAINVHLANENEQMRKTGRLPTNMLVGEWKIAASNYWSQIKAEAK